MKTLILAAGRFGQDLKKSIGDGRDPRLDIFELARELRADVIDFNDAETRLPWVRRLGKGTLGLSLGVAVLGYKERHNYDAILTTGEDIGLPLAAMLKKSSAKCAHTLIAHTLFPRKKRIFFSRLLNVESRIDRILAYATSEEELMVGALGIPRDKVHRIYYHADTRFFAPQPAVVQEPDLICAAGQLLRDYDTLVDAVRDLPVRLQIAAGSPWIQERLEPGQELPQDVSWSKLNRYDLRDLYARAAIAVVPIKQNEYQTGIATILEMMAMGKCLIVTKTRGQTDTIVDGETGIYVPPGDPVALRAAIERMLAAPDEARRMGEAARRFVEREASLDVFVDRLASDVRAAVARRASSSS